MSPRQTNVGLVRTIRESLPEALEWSERDVMVLELAEAQARDLDALEADIAMVGVRAESGILNQALREARQARVALGRLIGLVDIVDEASTSSLHASKAARARWSAAA